MSTLVPRMKRITYSTVAGPPQEDHVSVVITTSAVDREGDIIVPEGMDITNYQKNPIVLFGHNHWDVPVGVVTSITRENGKGISVTMRPLENDSFADRVWNAVYQNVLRTVSVGFRVLKYEPRKGGGYIYTKTELLEVSWVPVPANPQALRELESRGLGGPVPVACGNALLTSLDAQLRDGRVLSRAAQERVTAALTMLRNVVRTTNEEDADEQETAVTLEDDDAAVVLSDDGSFFDVDRSALRAAVDVVVDREIAHATGRIPEGNTVLTRGGGDAVINMDRDELAEIIRRGLGAAIDEKLRYITGRVD